MNIVQMIGLALMVAGLPTAIAGEKPNDKHSEKAVNSLGSRENAGPARVSGSSAREPWLNVEVSITPHEREIIQCYVENLDSKGKGRKRSKSLPPGLAKKVARGSQLPPGWQKKCVRGAVMPEDVHRQCHPLPREVIAKLPPPPPGTILVAVNGKIVRLLQATREILDVFDIRF